MAALTLAPRRSLSVAEALVIAEDLRHGRRDTISDVRFPEGFQLQMGTLQGVSFSNCRLWLTIGGGMWRGGAMEDCRFVDVDLDPLTMYGADVRGVTFERVSFGVRAMGGIDDTRIDDTWFTDCRLVDFEFHKSTLDAVRFDGGWMDRVRFDTCSLVDVRLASPVEDVTMVDCSFDRSDISSSDIVDVTLTDWRSADLRLPRQRTGFFVTPAEVSEVLSTILADLGVPFRERVFGDVVMAGFDLVAVSERFFMSELGADRPEASLLVDALFPRRLEALSQVRQTMRAYRR